MNKKAIIYARTACTTQNTKDEGIKRQVQACSALAKKSRLTITDTVLHKGVSGLNGSSERLFNLLKLCKEKKARYLIVRDVDRLSRNYKDCIRFLFLSKSKGVDLLTVVSGEEWIKECYEKHYKKLLSQAIKRGIAKARKRKSLTKNL